MPIELCLENCLRTDKPTRSEISAINNQIVDSVISVSVSELGDVIKQIGEQGCTFCPATFDGSRNKENFNQMQLFALDFDNSDSKRGTITPDEVKQRCSSYGIPVTAMYETFSSKKGKPRFRALFLNDAPVTDKRLAEDMNRLLGALFPEADLCWKNCAGMYFGGKKVLYINDDLTDTINPDLLIKAHDRYVYINDKNGKHYKEKINRFWKNGKPNVASCDAVEKEPNAGCVNNDDKNGGDLPSPIILYTNIESGKIPPFYNVTYSDTLQRISDTSTAPMEQNTKRKAYRSDILNKLPSKCKLYNDFIHGVRELSHEELWGIATNLCQVEGGRELFLDTCTKYPTLHDKDNPRSEWGRQLSYIKKAGYFPQGCDKFCPFKGICHHCKNMLATVKPEFMERVDDYSIGLRSREEVQAETKRAIRKACDATDTRVHVINSMTAIGKTSILIELIAKRSGERFLIAEPTNLMKGELLHSLDINGLNAIGTSSLDELNGKISDKLWTDLDNRRSRGDETTSYISKLLKEAKLIEKVCLPEKPQHIEKEDIPVLSDFMAQKQKVKNFKGTVVTTHRYLAVCDKEWLKEFDHIIIDEDILYKLIATSHNSVSMRELKKIAKTVSCSALDKKIEKLKKALRNESDGYIKLDSIDCDCDNSNSDLSFNTKAFCKAEHFYIHSPCNGSNGKTKYNFNKKKKIISYVVPLELPADLKLIVVSATANEEVYEQFFGTGRVKFKMCHRAPYEGTLQQYYGLSMSRNSLENHPGIIPYLQEYFGIPDSNVITYMSMCPGDLHFGNAEGSNMLEGQDILVVGSAYQPPFIYVLAAAALGFLDFDIVDTDMHNQQVEYNGYRFKYYAFDDEDMRTVQLWMTESELEQAVGRARLLWHDCTVYLFSNFPVQQAQMINGYTVYSSFIKSKKHVSAETDTCN